MKIKYYENKKYKKSISAFFIFFIFIIYIIDKFYFVNINLIQFNYVNKNIYSLRRGNKKRG